MKFRNKRTLLKTVTPVSLHLSLTSPHTVRLMRWGAPNRFCSLNFSSRTEIKRNVSLETKEAVQFAGDLYQKHKLSSSANFPVLISDHVTLFVVPILVSCLLVSVFSIPHWLFSSLGSTINSLSCLNTSPRRNFDKIFSFVIFTAKWYQFLEA